MSAPARRPRGRSARPRRLRRLLDATPAAVACFDAALRVVYANTAFTMTTGAQSGATLDDEITGGLATAVREMLDRLRRAAPACGSPAAGGCRCPARCSRSTRGMIGMVLDAGAHEALAVLADEQSALRRVATLVAAGPEPDAVFTAVAEEAGRLLRARSAATIRYEGALRVHGRALDATASCAASRSARPCRWTTATG